MTPAEYSDIQSLKEECGIGKFGAEFDDFIYLFIKLRYISKDNSDLKELFRLLEKLQEEKQ